MGIPFGSVVLFAVGRLGLASLLETSGPYSERWGSYLSFVPEPQNPDTDMPNSLHRFAGSLIYGDLYFVYGKIHLFLAPAKLENLVRSY